MTSGLPGKAEYASKPPDCQMLRKCGSRASKDKEPPLDENIEVGHRRGVGWVLWNGLDMDHCQVYIEEEEEDPEAAD